MSKAVIARTNLGLLLKAIEYVTEKKNVKHVYFEGNFNSYTYADEGASLYDVLNLYNHKPNRIRDALIKNMKDLAELEDYIEKTEDAQLGMMVEIVKEYGNSIPNILKKIKEKHLNDEDKHQAEIIFSTVHRCKGMEYDSVLLVNDFINKKKLDKLKNEEGVKEHNLSRINEEINLLYVAITRAKCRLEIPEALLPPGFPASRQIRILKDKEEWVSSIDGDELNFVSKEKAYSHDSVRAEHKDAYRPWTEELDEELTIMYCEGVKIKEMAEHFGRTRGAIKSRIRKLELEELYGNGE